VDRCTASSSPFAATSVETNINMEADSSSKHTKGIAVHVALLLNICSLFVSLVYCAESTVRGFVVREKYCWRIGGLRLV
jgi:hypothetical protein